MASNDDKLSKNDIFAIDVQLDFVTLGMFIIDEIHFAPPRKPELDVLGGAGSWSVLGARLFREAPASKKVSWTVHRGSDFPQAIDEQIELLETSCNLIDTPDRLTTRGWNGYPDGDDAKGGKSELRSFEYTTPKLAINETHLSEEQVLAKCFHLICSPKRCISLVKGISKRRNAIINQDAARYSALSKPVFVWEPVPYDCRPEELENTIMALPYVDVVSPNHHELAEFFGEPSSMAEADDKFFRVHSQCERLLKAWPSRTGMVVVRCGEEGCFWMTGDGFSRSLKPYHRRGGVSDGLGDSLSVVDPTGAGNSFLGAFGTELASGGPELEERVEASVQCGLVAASFAIEQVGLPKMTVEHGQERWNGDSVQRRLEALKKKSRA